MLVTQLCPTLCDPWTVACQVPLSMGFSRQEYCSGLPCPFPGDLTDAGIEPGSPALQADSLPSEPLNTVHIIPCTFGGFPPAALILMKLSLGCDLCFR